MAVEYSSNQSLTRTMLADIHLLVKEEKWINGATIPKYGVERGVEISDHVQRNNESLRISGTIMWDHKHKYPEKIRKIKEWMANGTVLTYSGRDVGSNFLIEDFDHSANVKIGNGYTFTMTLTEVRFAKNAAQVAIEALKTQSKNGKQQTAGNANEVYHVTKRGDTYTKLAKQYGTSWQQIKEWAKYPDTKIPVGVKVRVK